MGNQLQVFKQQELLGKEFKIYGTVEEPMFLAKDIAEWIEYDTSSINKMLNKVDDEEKVRTNVPTLGGTQEMWLVTEDGLYEVLMQSRKPIAKEFKREVKTILKNIRKHGAHMTEDTIEKALTSPDFLIQLATNLKTEQEARKVAEQKRLEAEADARAKQEVISTQKPKVDFVNSYVVSTGLLKMGEVAKTFGVGRNTLYQMLRDANILMSDNKPYQYYMNIEWFEVKTLQSNLFANTVTLVTPKGLYGISKKLKLVLPDK